jgi:hypothetical protein
MCIALGAIYSAKKKNAARKEEDQNPRSVTAGPRPASPSSKVPAHVTPQNGTQNGGYTQGSKDVGSE